MDHNDMLRKVLKICRQQNSKLNIGKQHLRSINIPFSGEIVSRYIVQQDPYKLYMLIGILFMYDELPLQILTGNIWNL